MTSLVSPSLQDRRGSVLIVAAIFTSMLALIVIPSYLKLSEGTLRSSHRGFYNHAALDLAETGLEHAIWALNQASAGLTPWSDWEVFGADARAEFSDFTYAGEIQGTVKVHIFGYESENPEVVTRASIVLVDGQTVERYMYARLTTSGRRLFAFGMLARETITASGGARFDSWISDPDKDPSTPYVPYHQRISRDKAAIASASTAEPSINLGSSDVYGTASVGAASYAGLDVDWGGQVGPMDKDEWDSSDTTDLHLKDGWKVSTQTGALTTNFTASFEDVTAPDEILPTVRAPYVLPYHGPPYNTYYDEETIGTPGTTTILQMNSLSVSAGADLEIAGDVVLILPVENAKTFQVIQGGSLRLQEGATLTVYTSGDIEISGAGLVNSGAPRNLQIWGTNPNPDSQSIVFQGSGELSGTIYAPNARVTLPGATQIFGAVVGHSVNMTGSGSFHFDESLKELAGSGGGGGPASVQYIEELYTADERGPYIEYLNF